ncbi:MAG TPA: septum formation initiator family protein [Acidimicrobiales bacterium]|nr:septum formation initiator family protein [Acidimicrobiales bacterium]
MRRAVRILLVMVGLGALVFLFVLPGRTWLQQGQAMSRAGHKLAVLNAENAALSRQAAQLQNPAYVAQIARQQYGLVKPGDQAYGILLPPVPTSTTTVPPAAG